MRVDTGWGPFRYGGAMDSRIWALSALFAMSVTAGAKADRLDRENLLQYHVTPDRVAPVKSTSDWQKRRAEILAGMQSVMGPLPGAEKRVALDVRIENE